MTQIWILDPCPNCRRLNTIVSKSAESRQVLECKRCRQTWLTNELIGDYHLRNVTIEVTSDRLTRLVWPRIGEMVHGELLREIFLTILCERYGLTLQRTASGFYRVVLGYIEILGVTTDTIGVYPLDTPTISELAYLLAQAERWALQILIFLAQFHHHRGIRVLPGEIFRLDRESHLRCVLRLAIRKLARNYRLGVGFEDRVFKRYFAMGSTKQRVLAFTPLEVS